MFLARRTGSGLGIWMWAQASWHPLGLDSPRAADQLLAEPSDCEVTCFFCRMLLGIAAGDEEMASVRFTILKATFNMICVHGLSAFCTIGAFGLMYLVTLGSPDVRYLNQTLKDTQRHSRMALSVFECP